jgi:[ribosomal protein S18]-alanine N-acetyltransferase
MASNPESSAQVRPALDSDLHRILEIERAAAAAAHWPQSDYERALVTSSPRRLLLVAEFDAQVEGFLVARSLLVTELATEWEIENVVVAETARRRGLGLALVTALLEQISLNKAPNDHLVVDLEVRESNLAARQLYEKAGFRLDNRRPAYYQLPQEDAVVYRYKLQSLESPAGLSPRYPQP